MLTDEWKDKMFFSEVTLKCIDTVLSNWGFIFFLLIHQNFGASFCMPKIGYQSQKQPLIRPANIKNVCH